MNRIKQIRQELAGKGLDALIVTKLTNIQYLTNFSGSNATLIIKPRSLSFITDGRYAEQVKTELYDLPRLKTYIKRNVSACIQEDKLLANCGKVGIEGHSMTVAQFEQFKKDLKPVRFKSVTGLVEKTTQAKTEQEVAQIRAACKITDQVYEYILNFVKPGMTENEVAAEISYQGRKRGAEADAFEIIVASGARSALPHGRAGAKKIKKGDVVTLDFGFRVNGLHSDMTRTFVMGRPKPEFRKIYNLVNDALTASIEASAVGMRTRDLDAVARDIIKAGGYGDAFQHSLGHGLGIDVHEGPGLSPLSPPSSKLVDGNVYTLEPGIYLQDTFGVRIEDDVYLNNGSLENLTHSPKELLSI